VLDVDTSLPTVDVDFRMTVVATRSHDVLLLFNHIHANTALGLIQQQVLGAVVFLTAIGRAKTLPVGTLCPSRLYYYIVVPRKRLAGTFVIGTSDKFNDLITNCQYHPEIEQTTSAHDRP